MGRNQHFPIEIMRAMGKLGLMGVLVPEEYGGAGLGYFEYVGHRGNRKSLRFNRT